jgi:hypothetical protein
MKQLIYKLLILFIGFQVFACKNSSKNSEEMRIDFIASSPKTGIGEGDNKGSVVLRVALLGSNQDLLKYACKNNSEEQSRLEYYNLNLKKDIFLVSGTDTIPCIDSHMEQLYMQVPYRNFLLYFGEHTIEENDEILIVDKVFSNKIITTKINAIS